MKGISHKQAVKLIHLGMDGLLKESQSLSLNEHLDSCDSCRAYAVEMDAFPARLQNEFQARWDRNAGPSYRVFEHVTRRARKIPMTNRISSSIRLMASAFLVAFLILGINFVILQMKSNPIKTIGTQSVSSSELNNNRLIAFTSEKDGNFEIYTMSADGSNLINLTNNSAQDANPVWSPDGKHMVFESDRAGTKQLYLMNSDGSNIVQLTHDGVDNQLPVTYDSPHSIWSPDGNKILFLQNDQDGKSWTLNSIQINSENKTALLSDNRQFATASWSPSGDYIGLVLFDEPEPDRLLPNLYVVDADGSNLREISKFLPPEEHFFVPYVWSSDGRSVIFPAQKLDPYRQTIFELRLSDNSLTTVTVINAMLFDWYDGISLITDFNIESQPLVWLRPDGTSSTLDYLKGANPADCYLDKERSLRGNLAIGSYCKQDDKVSLYWVNTDGSTIQQLPDLEVPVVNGGFTGLTLSPDEKFVTFNFESEDETNLYIWNMEEALKDASIQPIKLLVGNSKLRYIPAWQPIMNNDIVEEEQAQRDNRLIAFTSKQGENFDIYTMHADGSGLTNITNNSAFDSNPFWSPDGKSIAFESGRDGSWRQIYLMNADGSNVVQLTHDQADHQFIRNYGASSSPWSPDGNKLVISQKLPGEEKWTLYALDIKGENKTPLVSEPNIYNAISWSPDGQHIAFLADDLQNLGGNRIYMVNANGSGLRNVTESLQQSEQLVDSDYYWSPDGQSIFFVALFQKTNPYWTAYEARLDTNSLIEHATTNVSLIHWQNSISIVGEFSRGSPIKWSRSDETTSTLYPYENCQQKDDALSGSYIKRSSNGNWAINAYCPNGDFWFYYANPDGTMIQQLLNSPISAQGSDLIEILWSPDDKFIAFNMASSDVSDLYVLDISKALIDSSIQPVKLTNSFGASWQPVLNNEVVKKDPTPEPTQIVKSNDFPPIGTNKGNGEWIAFLPFNNEIYSPEDMKMDVYMIHPDGSELTNLTNSPDHYFWLEWSPNGNDLLFLRSSDTAGDIDILRKIEPMGFEVLVHTGVSRDAPFLYRWSPNSEQIAYVDNHAGHSDIYTIYADGRGDTQPKQLTNDSGQEIDIAWSPDGSQMAYQRTIGDQLSIMVMDVNGSNQHEVARGRGEVRLYWSVNGNSIYASSTKNNWLGCDGCVQAPAIYRIDLNGPSVQQIYYESEFRQAFWDLYETPQNTLYFMRIDPPHFIELWGTWFRADANSVTEIGEMDPHHTCNAANGNVLNERISPNPRFSVISNFCGRVFNLYLADRDAMPEKRFNHLLQLPLNTLGQGGDFATVPMVWSPDGRWIAYDNGNAAIYLLNVEGALQDPATDPLLLWQSENDLSTILEIAWQPASNHEVVEEEPTPKPTQTSSVDSLIAFTADNNDATNPNMDIYTLHSDGSNLTNLTHDPAKDFNANDYNPVWSPDQKKIAFMSDRGGSTTGNTNIFVMNRDGSGLTQLTHNSGYDAFLSWSPNGEKIIYYSSSTAESNAKGQLMVMNANGSNKTVLTPLGYYYFRSWSPDSQKIVYVQSRFNGESYQNDGIHVVDIDGKNRHEWFTDNIYQIHWEDPEHFLGVAQTGNGSHTTSSLYLFNMDGSEIELVSHNAPIVAIFNRSYVVEGQDGLIWFTLEGTPISSSPWNVLEKCETTGNQYQSTSLSISPDQKHALAVIYCKDATWFYLVNENGSEINQLGAPIDGSVGILPYWSPDGQYISLFVIDYEDDLYLIDIQKMSNDPTAPLILLATNVSAGFGTLESLIASNDTGEKPTPEPPVFSLSVYAAEKLAFFDVLEPSYLPAGYALEGVAYDPWTQKVAMKYVSPQGNGSILIYQQRGDLIHYPDLRGYITPVPIGGIEAEFIQGAWIYESPDTTEPTWDSRADSYTLSWQKGEFVFSVNFIGGETITPLLLNELVTIGESLK